jgi:hypothetical protein
MSIITNEEFCMFLQLQQGSRVGYIGSVDKKPEDQEQRKAERLQKQE